MQSNLMGFGFLFVGRYLVKYDVCQLPQLFVIAKNKSVLWYGDVQSKGVEVPLRFLFCKSRLFIRPCIRRR